MCCEEKKSKKNVHFPLNQTYVDQKQRKHTDEHGEKIKSKAPSSRGLQYQSGFMCVAGKRFMRYRMRSASRSERKWRIYSRIRPYLMRWRREWRGWDESGMNRLMVEWYPPLISSSCCLWNVKSLLLKKKKSLMWCWWWAGQFADGLSRPAHCCCTVYCMTVNTTAKSC